MASTAKKTLSDKTTSEIAEQLAHFLADTVVLYVKTLNFHWNMVGPGFFMYHKLLQKEYEELAIAIDDLAERIRQLGKPAPGSMEEFLGLSCIKEAPRTHLSEERMVRELVHDHEAMEEHCHIIIKFATERGDEGTADLLIDRVRAHAKEAWLLRSHFSKKR